MATGESDTIPVPGVILKILFCIFPAALKDINIYLGSKLPYIIVLFCYYVRVLTPKLNPSAPV